MDCFYPLNISGRGKVPCGICVPCLKRRQSDWTIRLTEELKVSSSCFFVTLTYDEDNVPREVISDYPPFTDGVLTPVLCRRDVQLWMKRIRKLIAPAKIRYFLCGEYGSKTLRPHYHAILFNFPNDFNLLDSLHKTWKKGFVVVDKVSPARIAYVAKYCSCYTFLPRRYRDVRFRPFVLASRRPAIGSNYLTQSKIDYHRETLSTFIVNNGFKSSLPKYYRDRIFDDQMKLDIRSRADSFRARRDAEFQRDYFPSNGDPYQDVRDNYNRIYMSNINKRKL